MLKKWPYLFTIVVIWLACKGLPHLPTDPTPSPTPSPSAPPSARITAPLAVSGDRFIPPILGSIICCSDGVDEHGWPLFDTSTVDQIAAAGGNWTTLRLGPDIYHDHTHPYIKRGGRYNLAEWDEEYWNRVSSLIAYAQEKGVYVEVDLVDGWSLKNDYREQFSPWAGANNPNGVDYDCALFRSQPTNVVEEWVYKAVSTLGRYPNVIWQVGNETGVCGSSQAWEEGIVRIVRASGGGQLIGTNSGDPGLCPSCSFDSYHQRDLCSPAGRPCQVNEFEDISVDAWASLAKEGWLTGRPFHMWRSGNWHEADNQRALKLLGEIVNGHP